MWAVPGAIVGAQIGSRLQGRFAEGRTELFFALLFGAIGIIFLLNPGYEMELFTDPRGRMMLGAGLVTMLLGIAVMVKMVKFEI